MPDLGRVRLWGKEVIGALAPYLPHSRLDGRLIVPGTREAPGQGEKAHKVVMSVTPEHT